MGESQRRCCDWPDLALGKRNIEKANSHECFGVGNENVGVTMSLDQPVGRGQKRSRKNMNTSFKAFLLPLALAVAFITRGNAQNNNQTPGTVVSWGTRVISYEQPGTRYQAIAGGAGTVWRSSRTERWLLGEVMVLARARCLRT